MLDISFSATSFKTINVLKQFHIAKQSPTDDKLYNDFNVNDWIINYNEPAVRCCGSPIYTLQLLEEQKCDGCFQVILATDAFDTR